MKLVMIRRDQILTSGCLIGTEILDFDLATAVMPEAGDIPRELSSILDEATGSLSRAREIHDRVSAAGSSTLERLRQTGALANAGVVALGSPLPSPRNLFLHGQAYHSHARDWHADARPDMPEHPPAGFHKSIASIVGPGDAIVLPERAPDNVDFEGELCVVFGRECHNVSRTEAMDYVAGYTVLNDVSARDWIPRIRDRSAPPIPTYFALNTMYKNFPTFCPLGPNVTTRDEIPDHRALRLTTRLNGEVMQDASVADLIWDIPELIEAYSAVNRFMPGDVMSTGTPGGVGAGRNPPRFLADGDVVAISVEGVGELVNPVAGFI